MGAACTLHVRCVDDIHLSPESIAELLRPYLDLTEAHAPSAMVMETKGTRIYKQLAVYLDLILKWNERINLTAIRSPDEIVRRHFGESLFAGARLGECATLLDFGSGAGFPGLPIQILKSDVQVTLAESRNRKAAFLREVVRTLHLPSEIWAGRVEAMPADRKFETVTLRAVEDMKDAVCEASCRAKDRILILATMRSSYLSLPKRFDLDEPLALPNSAQGALWIARRR